MSCPLLPGKCEPCTGATPKLSADEILYYGAQTPEWTYDPAGERITRVIKCKDFADVLVFLGMLGSLSEREGHHPDFEVTKYRILKISFTTHAIKGLSVNDYVMARLIDEAWTTHVASHKA